MEEATNEGRKRVNRSLCCTREGLNEALKRTDERKEGGERQRLLEKYAMSCM